MNPFIRYIRSLKEGLFTKNSFLQNSAWLFSASALSTFIQFLFFPILSRIYDPDAYGVFGLFNAIVANIAIIAGLNLNRAFVLPKKEKTFRALLHLSTRSVVIISALTLLITLLLKDQILSLFNAKSLGAWIYLTGPAVFLVAMDRMIIEWAVRKKAFKKFAVFNVQTALGSKIFNVFYGLKISASPSGLILTHMLNFTLRLLIYLKWVIGVDRKYLIQGSDREGRKAAIKEYRNFPMYLLPGNFLNSFSNQLAIFLLPLFGMNMVAVGIYTFSLIALDLPVKLLSSAFGPVFLQKAAEVNHNDPRELGRITWRLFLNLSMVAFLPIIILFIAGEPLYTFVFGDEWMDAGIIAEVLALSYFFRISSSPISSVMSVIRKEKHILYFQIMLFSMRFFALLLGFLGDFVLFGYMILYSLFNGLAYFILAIWVFRLLRFPLWKVIGFKLLSFGILLTLGWILKSLLF